MNRLVKIGLIIIVAFFLIYFIWGASQHLSFVDANLEAALLASDANVNGDRYLTKNEAKNYDGTLDLSYQNIGSLEGIEAFENLQGLIINDNILTSLVPLENLQNLNLIYAQNNQISNTGKLSNLKLQNLDLSGNGLGTIPTEVLNCTTLKNLYLSNNKISSIEGIETLSNLEILHLTFNQIKDLAPASKLQHLKEFIITENGDYDAAILDLFNHLDRFEY